MIIGILNVVHRRDIIQALCGVHVDYNLSAY
jgi:hypothetical protein